MSVSKDRLETTYHELDELLYQWENQEIGEVDEFLMYWSERLNK